MRYHSSPVVQYLLTAFVSLPAFGLAQELEPQIATKEQIEEIVVTGSHVQRSNLDTVAPLIVFDSDDLKDAGVNTLGDFARYLPQNVNAENESSFSSKFGGNWGSAQFNLRGIDDDGTLTLVNGRRIAPFGSSSNTAPFVDINSIPVASIERIEVLKDGASAIYGADAVAGVVNIILKEKLDGLTVEGGYLTTTEGDGEELDVSIAGGWSNDSTSLTGTASYFDRAVIYARDREWSSDGDYSDRGGYNQRSSYGSPGTADLSDTGRFLADPACPTQTAVSSLAVVVPGEWTVCKFNWAHAIDLRPAATRIGLTTALHHAFSQRVAVFGEFLFNRNETETTWPAAPLIGMFVPEFHPDNPFGEDLVLRYRALDAGNREWDTIATTWRAVAGLRGFVADWEWEAALMGSQGEVEQRRNNDVLFTPFQEALLGLGGPNGDQFYNPFGLNPQNDPAVIEQFILAGTKIVQANEEWTFDLLTRGDFASLPGGPIGIAAGIQLRHQTAEQSADEAEYQGDYLGGPFEPVNADRDVYSTFIEFMVPMHETLEAQLAVRYDHYSDFGSTTNPKFGLGWRPLDELLVRGTWGTSFRPPAFGELFDPFVQFPWFFINDPYRCPVTGDWFDCINGDVPAEWQGNPNLKPDEAETITLGVVWEPGFAPGLALVVDFWAIEHTNRIAASDGFDFLLDIPPEGNPYVIRNPPTPEDVAAGIPGTIAKLSYTYFNADRLETNGVDIDVSYVWATPVLGDFSAQLSYAYLNRYETGVDFGEITFTEDLAGKESSMGLPKHRGNLNLGWARGGHGVAALVRFAGDFQSDQNWIVGGEESDTPFIVDEYVQFDLQYRYTFAGLNDGILRLGCRNCTDEAPPLRNYDGSDGFHEGRGAMIYVRWTQPF